MLMRKQLFGFKITHRYKPSLAELVYNCPPSLPVAWCCRPYILVPAFYTDSTAGFGNSTSRREAQRDLVSLLEALARLHQKPTKYTSTLIDELILRLISSFDLTLTRKMFLWM